MSKHSRKPVKHPDMKSVLSQLKLDERREKASKQFPAPKVNEKKTVEAAA